MGRPKKSKTDTISTKEKILVTARELFAEKGFEAVSVRDITRTLGLNEASLYNHYKNKAHLFDVILDRLKEDLINPAFSINLSKLSFNKVSFNLGDFLIDGAKIFFSKTDNNIALTWRMLMISQYRFEKARDCIYLYLLDAPASFFKTILLKLQEDGFISKNVDCFIAAKTIGSIFFEYSFRSNLNLAWDISENDDFKLLERQIRLFSDSIS